MDYNLTELENIGSPFFLFPQPPERIQENLQTPRETHEYLQTFGFTNEYHSDLESSLSPELSSGDGLSPGGLQLTDLDQSHYAGTGELFDFADTTFTASPSICDENSCVFNDSPEQTTDLYNEHVDSNESVTDKLKNVLKSRQKLRDQSENNANQNCSYNNGDFEHSDEHIYSQTSLRFPPCCVCGGNASGLHYGVNTCEPCKGFFTRYLRKKDKEEYVCNKSDNCIITNRLRGNCSACRLKKCLELGMSRQNSRLGRYSLTRRMETIMTVKQLERRNQNRNNTNVGTSASDKNCSTSSRVVPEIIDDSLTHDKRTGFTVNVKSPNGFSEKLIKSLVEYMEKIQPYGEELESHDQIMDKLHKHFEAYQLKIQVFGNLKTIPKEEYFNLLKVHGIEIDHRMMYLKQSANEIVHVIERYCNFAKQIPNFSQLTNKDQSNLLKSSRYDFFMILMHESYLHDKKVFLAHNGVAFHQEEVADKFFSRKLVLTVCDMYYRLQRLKLSSKEKALLIAISLLFTDRCTLDNPEIVEKIQFCLVQLLRNQLEKTCKTSAFRRFTQIINCLTIMRNSSELYLKEYNLLCKDEHVIEEVPIMTEMLFDH